MFVCFIHKGSVSTAHDHLENYTTFIVSDKKDLLDEGCTVYTSSLRQIRRAAEDDKLMCFMELKNKEQYETASHYVELIADSLSPDERARSPREPGSDFLFCSM